MQLHRAALLMIVITIVLLSACAAPNNRQAEKRLLLELKKWESFDSHGIAEISYKGLSLRKMFNAAKNHDTLRLDIFDGGIMGVTPEPLISIYAGEYIALQSSLLPILEQMNPAMLIPSDGLAMFGNADSLFTKHGAEIIQNRMLQLGEIQISFLVDYRLDSIHDPESNATIQANYNSNRSLSELVFSSAEDIQLKLIFDEVAYIEPEIIALPKPQATDYDKTANPFQNMDLKHILQNFIDNTE